MSRNEQPAPVAVDRSFGRQPGYYWLRLGCDWHPYQWTGKAWWGVAMMRPLGEDEIEEIGPRLVPPNAKVQRRP